MKLFTFMDNEDSVVDNHHIDVLDGIRALAIIIVVWLHLWEQCWLMPIADTPFLSFLRINNINLDWLPRTGYIMVTMMILLSGFCLYLPYARHDLCGEKLPSTKIFFKKRFARIVPSYLFCVIAIFIYNIIMGIYSSPDFPLNGVKTFWAKDLFSHLTFSFNLIPEVQSFSQLNGVLWTVALEVQFYLIFPLLAKAFRKKPVLTYTIMTLISFAATFYANGRDNIGFLMHQLPTYLGVYANGFLGAQIFVGMTKKIKREKYSATIATIISIFCIYVYYLMMQTLCASADTDGGVNAWQMHNRYYVSILFLIFCISTSYSLGFYRKIFSNKVAVFMATISFNLYMWHQFIAVAFVKNHIPFYTGDTPPNQLGDRTWMWNHFLLSIFVSLIMAILTTYFIEKPMAGLILKKEKTANTNVQKQPLKKPDKNLIRNKRNK